MVKKEIDRTLDSVGNGYRLCILGDLNGWIGDRTRAGITDALGVPGENDNGRRVDCVSNTHFKHISLHKYTRVARDQGGGETKSMIDLVPVKRDMLQDVRDGTRPLRPLCCIV